MYWKHKREDTELLLWVAAAVGYAHPRNGHIMFRANNGEVPYI
jgi:hypothetical protein